MDADEEGGWMEVRENVEKKKEPQVHLCTRYINISLCTPVNVNGTSTSAQWSMELVNVMYYRVNAVYYQVKAMEYLVNE